MRQWPAVGLLFFVSLGFSTVICAQEENAPKLGVTMANEPWTLAFDVKGFSIKVNALQSDGRVYLLAENQKTNVTLSVYLKSSGNSDSLRLPRHPKGSPKPRGGL
jgi:hypothetical protein